MSIRTLKCATFKPGMLIKNTVTSVSLICCGTHFILIWNKTFITTKVAVNFR